MSAPDKWAAADRISDRIVNMINEEMVKPDFSPLQMMAGQMLALVGFMRTAPNPPREMSEARVAIMRCLQAMQEPLQ